MDSPSAPLPSSPPPSPIHAQTPPIIPPLNGGLKKFNAVSRLHARLLSHLAPLHSRTPYVRRLPLAALVIIVLLVLVNILVWIIAIMLLILASRHSSSHHTLLSTAALAYSLGLRHALDADHISAIDLMTRRLVASGQRPVTVGTFFSLGHSTIVVVTSIVVAATAAGVTKHFGGFGSVGGIVGSAVSAAFLLLLGMLNAWILIKLVECLRREIDRPASSSGDGPGAAGGLLSDETWNGHGGGGILFRVLKRLFKLIDRPWKMYPLGVLFGLGFDTSSEVALLGISSIQGAKGTSLWLILIFPVLFTVGMCLIDTIDGALMLSLYVGPMDLGSTDRKDDAAGERERLQGQPDLERDVTTSTSPPPSSRASDPLPFLYYSTILTLLTVLVALIIGTLQLLTLILNVIPESEQHNAFWSGVAVAGDNYEVIGGSICASFVVVGLGSVACYGRWRAWVDRRREQLTESGRREQPSESRGEVENSEMSRIIGGSASDSQTA